MTFYLSQISWNQQLRLCVCAIADSVRHSISFMKTIENHYLSSMEMATAGRLGHDKNPFGCTFFLIHSAFYNLSFFFVGH